jgi:hypothetical protein
MSHSLTREHWTGSAAQGANSKALTNPPDHPLSLVRAHIPSQRAAPGSVDGADLEARDRRRSKVWTPAPIQPHAGRVMPQPGEMRLIRRA